jgi:hypothetical protein
MLEGVALAVEVQMHGHSHESPCTCRTTTNNDSDQAKHNAHSGSKIHSKPIGLEILGLPRRPS